MRRRRRTEYSEGFSPLWYNTNKNSIGGEHNGIYESSAGSGTMGCL